jgi:hypothetical protein
MRPPFQTVNVDGRTGEAAVSFQRSAFSNCKQKGGDSNYVGVAHPRQRVGAKHKKLRRR